MLLNCLSNYFNTYALKYSYRCPKTYHTDALKIYHTYALIFQYTIKYAMYPTGSIVPHIYRIA